MPHRRVGSTGLFLSELGFGTGGNAGLMVAGGAAEQDRVVAHAIERGVTYFDTAPDYGDGLAEINLGRAFASLRARPAITTKVEIRAGDLDDIAGHIVRSTEASLKRLGLDVVEVLQIHNGPVAARPVLEGRGYKVLGLGDYLGSRGVLEGLERVLRAGKARHAGFICRGNDRDPAAELLETGQFHLLNLPYTLLNPTPGAIPSGVPRVEPDYGGIIDLARDKGAGVAVFSPLAGGLLTDALLAGHGSHPLARPKDIESPGAEPAVRKARAFAQLAERSGLSLVELAYRFILSHPGVTSLVGGISSIEQLDEGVDAVARGPLPAELLCAIEAVWQTWPDERALARPATARIG